MKFFVDLDGTLKIEPSKIGAMDMNTSEQLKAHAKNINYNDRCGGTMVQFFKECALELAEIAPKLEELGIEIEVDSSRSGLDLKFMVDGALIFKYHQFNDTFSLPLLAGAKCTTAYRFHKEAMLEIDTLMQGIMIGRERRVEWDLGNTEDITLETGKRITLILKVIPQGQKLTVWVGKQSLKEVFEPTLFPPEPLETTWALLKGFEIGLNQKEVAITE